MRKNLREYLSVCVRGKTYASDFSLLAAQLRYFHLAETTDPSLIQFLALIVHSHKRTHTYIHTEDICTLCTQSNSYTPCCSAGTNTHRDKQKTTATRLSLDLLVSRQWENTSFLLMWRLNWCFYRISSNTKAFVFVWITRTKPIKSDVWGGHMVS